MEFDQLKEMDAAPKEKTTRRLRALAACAKDGTVDLQQVGSMRCPSTTSAPSTE